MHSEEHKILSFLFFTIAKNICMRIWIFRVELLERVKQYLWVGFSLRKKLEG
jgi:hypothetical protein